MVTSVAVLSDGRIVSGSEDATFRIWDANSGDCVKKLSNYGKVSSTITYVSPASVVFYYSFLYSLGILIFYIQIQVKYLLSYGIDSSIFFGSQ